jgi:hypothetical protein
MIGRYRAHRPSQLEVPIKIQWFLKSEIGVRNVGMILANPATVELREATTIVIVAGITAILRSH